MFVFCSHTAAADPSSSVAATGKYMNGIRARWRDSHTTTHDSPAYGLLVVDRMASHRTSRSARWIAPSGCSHRLLAREDNAPCEMFNALLARSSEKLRGCVKYRNFYLHTAYRA